MKKVSSIDTDDILYQLITQAVSDGVITISGKVCPQGERPDGSNKEDIVINTITVILLSAKTQKSINILPEAL